MKEEITHIKRVRVTVHAQVTFKEFDHLVAACSVKQSPIIVIADGAQPLTLASGFIESVSVVDGSGNW